MGKSNEELQRLIDERDRELKIAQREAEKWKASSDLLESRVQGLVRMVNEMEEKMQARRRSVRRLYGQATQSVVHWAEITCCCVGAALGCCPSQRGRHLGATSQDVHARQKLSS